MKKSYLIVFAYFLCLCLMVLASFYDLQIDIALYNPENFYAKFFDLFGELPFYALIPFSLAVIATYLKTGKRGWQIGLSFACLVLSFIMACVCFQRFFGTLIEYYAVFLLSILSVALLWYCLSSAKEETIFKLFRFAIFAIVYCVTILLVNQGVKMLWGRCRFYTMVENGSYDAFTPWWCINGFGGGRSFYSGHTTSAMALLCLLPLARMLHINKRKYFALNALIVVFVALVAVSRLIYGAHFLSDVTMAVIVCGTIYLVLYKLIGNFLFQTNKQLSIFDLNPNNTQPQTQ